MLFQDFNKFILSLNYKEIGSQSAGFVMTLKLLSNKVRVTEIEAKLLSVLPIYFTVKITIFDLDDLNKYTCANIFLKYIYLISNTCTFNVIKISR